MSVSDVQGDKDRSIAVAKLFAKALPLRDGVYGAAPDNRSSIEEEHTSEAFSEKWTKLAQNTEDNEGWKLHQYRWYLRCYGFESETAFAEFLRPARFILDAGCGPGYKAAWFARLNPDATVVAMDLSSSILTAAKRYKDVPNMIFVRGDIAQTPFNSQVFDVVSCDQVLHHTDSPPRTVKEFARILSPTGTLNTYVYGEKALPRELLDEHFRTYAKSLSIEAIWELSDQLTRLGKTLADLNIEIDVPDIPALRIAGGKIDLQRFIYWNFLKCFWNPEHGFDASKMINFDWYSPSTAFRYSREKFQKLLGAEDFVPSFLHSEPACHSGRFVKGQA